MDESNAPTVSNVPLSAPYLGKGPGRRPRIAVISVILVIILIAVVIVVVSRPPTKTTTTTPVTATTPPTPYIPPALMQRSNVLYGVPAAPTQYNYYSSSSSSAYFVQYGLSFLQPLIAGNSIVPPSTVVTIPQQYTNLTSPLAVSFYIGATPNHSAAISNYSIGMSTLKSTFPNATASSISIGNMSTLFAYKSYGMNTYALFFVDNNYFVVLNIFGAPHLNESYITNVAAHITALIPAASS